MNGSMLSFLGECLSQHIMPILRQPPAKSKHGEITEISHHVIIFDIVVSKTIELI